MCSEILYLVLIAVDHLENIVRLDLGQLDRLGTCHPRSLPISELGIKIVGMPDDTIFKDRESILVCGIVKALLCLLIKHGKELLPARDMVGADKPCPFLPRIVEEQAVLLVAPDGYLNSCVILVEITLCVGPCARASAIHF